MKTIGNFISGYYYQSVWDFFEDDVDVWNEVCNEGNVKYLHQLLEDIDFLLRLSENKLLRKIEDLCKDSAISFKNANEVRNWLISLSNYIKKHIKL